MPQMAGECAGVRMKVTRQGFDLLTADQGTRTQHATCAAVIAALERAAASTPLDALGKVAAAEAARVQTLKEELASGDLSEGAAARKLCMLIGPPIESAVTAAVAASSGALRRARRGSTARGPAPQIVDPGPVRRRSSRRHSSAPYAHDASTGLTPMLAAATTLSFDEGDGSSAAVDAANAAFRKEAAVVRAKALLQRSARRAEAAEVVQSTWRLRDETQGGAQSG